MPALSRHHYSLYINFLLSHCKIVKRYDRLFEAGVYALPLRVLIYESVKVSRKQFVKIINHDVGAIVPETVRLSMAVDTDD